MPAADFSKLPPREPGTNRVHVVVDTAAGSRNKYKFDDDLGLFRLHKRLPVGAAFPFDFGFIPGTHADDGDALDVMIVGGEPTFVGCLVTVRLLGVIEAEQTERGRTIRNDRLIAMAETEKIHPTERSIEDLSPQLLEQIEHFFASYNRAEEREFRPIGRRGPAAAQRAVDVATVDRRRREASRRSRSRPRKQ